MAVGALGLRGRELLTMVYYKKKKIDTKEKKKEEEKRQTYASVAEKSTEHVGHVYSRTVGRTTLQSAAFAVRWDNQLWLRLQDLAFSES